VGLGHLSRMIFLAKFLQSEGDIDIRLCILTASEIRQEELKSFPHEYIQSTLEDGISLILDANKPSVMVYDLSLEHLKKITPELFRIVRDRGCYQIGIDNLLWYSELTDFTLVPAFRINSQFQQYVNSRVRWGWDSYLIPIPEDIFATRNNKLLVLTGSSDVAGLGKILPQLLNDNLTYDFEINWVQGPLAPPPKLPLNPKHSWLVHVAPDGLGNLMRHCSFALTIYGVSLFELISYQVPSVAVSPYNGKDDEDMQALEDAGIAFYGTDLINAIFRLNNLASDKTIFKKTQQKCCGLIQETGAALIAERIRSAIKFEIQV
jgi:spore coat polysaccharide biosynthesis predicted glycosyltransferase SpsG